MCSVFKNALLLLYTNKQKTIYHENNYKYKKNKHWVSYGVGN